MSSISKHRIVAAFFGAMLMTAGFAGTAWAEGAESKVSIPTTTEGIWKAVDQEMATLSQLIADKKLATLHEHAYAVRDLVAALNGHASKLSAADQAKLTSDEKFVAALASRLDQSGDSGDLAGAKSNYDKLKDIITEIHKLGPVSSKQGE